MSAPPSYKNLANVVKDYLTKGSDVHGWQLDANEDGASTGFNAFPFASPKAIGAHLSYECPSYHTTLKSKVSAAFTSWREYLPTIIYHTKVNNTSSEIEVDAAAASVKVTSKHSIFNASCKSSPLDGFVTDANVTTRVFDQVYAGASLQYDPKRSGVRDFTALMVRYACPHLSKGDVLGQYSLRDGFSVHVRVPLHTYMDAAVIAERRCFIAGVQARSPCGARLMLNTNVSNGTYTVTTIRNMNDIWKLAVTMTAPFASGEGAAAPRFGLKLTNMDAGD
ncbi:conserved hypothetical protein [Leishmania major strain Friedlin]|uniref:Uncharacterized protein n=1 Tax=Leishmania major TaxID=5664 RepID=Q4Q0P9_LEIMA|nr:conserved hypothetical protein [Leishmania major strain Friedlin]CAG9584065.1 hypothetical_protein_-_conserved [Leishmania major strain Friedlin]CAJ09485.1 conserved hypothetical protein [Leishmania major strain Friedlin]|eukprot:XP_001687099.1 conserved hypothetical protein [Leishmania major strain Friedlin]